jgi:hypothetical protein
MRGIQVTDLLPKIAAMTMKLCNWSKEFSFSAKKMGTKFVTYVRRGEGITFTSQKVQDLLRESVEASEKFASKDLSVLLLGSSARNQNSICGDGQPSIPNSA